ncbi:hypothetical protein OF83DRAFT_1086742 [Amylostereum chailletii]|nr:hypothetical protein OF83DRAFT_1086742 [Amylostereum chailletii]
MTSSNTSVRRKSYAVLDLSEDATIDEVKTAYKKLALKWHPDRHESDKEYASGKFVEIHEAYELLTAEVERPCRTASSRVPSSEPPRASHARTREDHPKSSPAPESRRPADAAKGSEPSKPSSKPPRDEPRSKSPRTRYATVPDDGFPIPATAGKDKTSAKEPMATGPATVPEASSSNQPFFHLAYISPGLRQPTTHLPRVKVKDEDKDSHGDFSDYVHLSKRDAPLDPPLDPITSTTLVPSSKSASTPQKEWVFPLEVSLEELYHGTTRQYQISTPTSQASSTPDEKMQSVKIIIPAVRETPHTYFRRVDRSRTGDKKYDARGTDLYMCLELPWAGVDELRKDLSDAHVVFSGVDGKEMRIPAPADLVAATNGSKVVGKGMPVCEGGKVVRHGDLYIRWDFFVPDKGQPTPSKWDSIKNAIHFKF